MAIKGKACLPLMAGILSIEKPPVTWDTGLASLKPPYGIHWCTPVLHDSV
jgi:hypothetical protein